MIYVQLNNSADEHTFSRNLLEVALLNEYGKKLCDFEEIILPGGKPAFKNSDIHFNISHTKGAAAVALSKTPVGIDIQKITAYSPRLAGRICTEKELDELLRTSDKDFLLSSFWAMRESYVKYTGEGLRTKIRDIPFGGMSHISRIGSFVISVSPSPMEIIFVK